MGGNHVGGQLGAGVLEQGLGLESGAGDVADQAIGPGGVAGQQHHRVRHAGRGQQRRLDLAQLDARTAQLHLEVIAAHVHQIAGAVPFGQVPGAVHARAGDPERVGHEPVGGERAPALIAARQLRARQIELADDAGRDRAHAGVEDVGAGVPVGAADGDLEIRIGVGEFVIDRADRGLGGTVGIVHRAADQLAQPAEQLDRQRLAAGVQVPERVQGVAVALGDQRREHRRHVFGDGDAEFAHEPGQVVQVLVAAGARNHQGRTDHGGQEALPDRDVEGQRGTLHDAVGAGDAVAGFEPAQLVHDGAVAGGHALGQAGGAGGVEDVGEVVGAQRSAALGIGDRGVRKTLECTGFRELRDVQHADTVEFGQLGVADGEHQVDIGGAQHVGDAVGRVGRIDRDVGRTGGHHGPQRHHHVDAALGGDADDGVRARARRDQAAGEPIHAPRQIRVSDLLILEDQRVRVGIRGRAGVEQPGHGLGGQRPGGGVAIHQQFAAFGTRHDLDVPGPGAGIGEQGTQHTLVGVLERADGGGVEKVGGVGDVDLDAVGRALRRGGLGQRPVQVELSHRGIDGERLDGQPVQLDAGPGVVLQGQGDLAQRRVRLGAHRIHRLDQHFERDHGVLEGGQVGIADRAEQLAQRRVRPHLGAQHQGVDEHADQVVDGLVATSGDRGADDDVAGARQAGQGDGQRGVQHHERGHALRGREIQDGRVQFGVEAAGEARAATAGHGGAGTIGGQGEHVGQAVQAAGPV
ncbi:hypothetical protein NS07_v2contig00080-0005 [Nocardia seriolae]|nr:hypothetical protein NS07_v2contig00080-0005 [Nocardia seriolae]